jgi:hypothetical protein
MESDTPRQPRRLPRARHEAAGSSAQRCLQHSWATGLEQALGSLSRSWQRHSEPGPVRESRSSRGAHGTNRPGCARSQQGTEFPESRFRASRVTFVRRQTPYRRSPRSRSRGWCSARAKRSSHRCRDKRCSVSSFAQEILAGAAADALPRMEHNAKRADRLQVAEERRVSKHRRGPLRTRPALASRPWAASGPAGPLSQCRPNGNLLVAVATAPQIRPLRKPRGQSARCSLPHESTALLRLLAGTNEAIRKRLRAAPSAPARTRVHAKAELRPIGNDGRSADDTPLLEIGETQGCSGCRVTSASSLI